jgi:SAM-dependent methyltransferase
LHERYVREWLWALVAGRIADAGDDETFWLRPGYEAAVTVAGGSGHWSRVAPQISAFARLEDLIVADFRLGRGLPAETYDALAGVFAAESGTIFQTSLLSEVLPRLRVTERLAQGGRVLDLGCGHGLALRVLAAEFAGSEFFGLDLSVAAVEHARQHAVAEGLLNCTFDVADIEPLEVTGTFDLVLAANAVHDLGNPARFFADVVKALAPDGVFCMHEISASADMRKNIAATPHVPGTLGFSMFHCLPLSLHRGGIAPGGMWGRERYAEALREAGFSHVEIVSAASDPLNDIFIARL